MTPEVKKRIAQIQRGELPEGYIQKMFGIAPENWEIKKVGDFCTISSGSTPRRSNNENFTGNILWVSSGELKQKYIDTTEEKISENAVKECNLRKYTAGTVVIAIYGLEAAGVRGTASIVRKTCTISQACMAFSDFQGVVSEFFYYWYLLYGQIIGTRFAQGTKQQNLGSDIVSGFLVGLPPVSAQQKIAEILTTQDRVIELKEKLIAEKQRQKTYLMQQLLTGKKRLPGFSGEWKSVRAKTVFANISNKNHDGSLEVLSATQDRGVIPRSQVDIDIKYDESSLGSYKKVEVGNFIISLRSFQGGIEYSEYEGIVSPAYTVLAPQLPIADGFYKQVFKSKDYINRLNVAVYGIRDGKQISYSDFGRLPIPSTSLEEQTAIAAVLSTADREIELLQQELEQEKQKKKSLMQLLLTGIVRV